MILMMVVRGSRRELCIVLCVLPNAARSAEGQGVEEEREEEEGGKVISWPVILYFIVWQTSCELPSAELQPRVSYVTHT